MNISDRAANCNKKLARFNLTVRMRLRRFTRLTNGHSKSLRHHTAMQALFIAWYNFGRNEGRNASDGQRAQ